MSAGASLEWIWIGAGWALGGAGLLLALWALFWDRARGRRRCPKCWYDMAGAEAGACDLRSHEPRVFRCPECGRAAWSDRKLARTRRRWRWGVTAAALLLMAWGVVTGHGVAGGWSTRKLNAIPHPLLRVALWACCVWDGLWQPAAPTLSRMPRVGQPCASQTVAEQWNDLLTAYRLAKALSEQTLALWRVPPLVVNAWPSAPLGFDYCSALEGLGENAWPAAGALVQIVEGRSPVGVAPLDHAIAFRRAMLVFPAMGDEAVEALPGLIRRALRDDAPDCPVLVATIVATSPHPTASLTNLLESRSERVVVCSLQELSAMKSGGRAAAPAVGRLARRGRTSILRAWAIEALASIDPGGKRAVRDLNMGLLDPDQSVRLAAARALESSSHQESPSAAPP